MEYKSLLNKYKIFEEMPGDDKIDEVIHISDGKNFTRGDGWVLDLIKNFEGLCAVDEIADRYDLYFKALEGCTLGDIHVFRVEEDIIGLIQKTDSKREYIPCPFPKMFIDGEIKINDNIKLFGLFVHDINSNTNKPYFENKLKERLPDSIYIKGMVKVKYKNDYFIMPYFNAIGNGMGGLEMDEELKKYLPNNLPEQVDMFICSFLNFINHPDVETIPRVYEEKEKIKHQTKGKVVKSSMQTIKVTGKTRIYIENLRSLFGGKIEWSHSFWVRGHFMKLQSERYKNKRGKTVWRVPHIKGKGQLIKKEYEVVDKNE